MEKSDLQDLIDHQRWLIENGLFNDMAKDTLYLYGSIVHKDVQAVHLVIDAANKKIQYTLYIPKSLERKIALYNNWMGSKSLVAMWRLRRLVRKEGSLNFPQILSRFVRDFCGDKWIAEVKFDDFSNYVDGLDDVKDGFKTDSSEGFDK